MMELWVILTEYKSQGEWPKPSKKAVSAVTKTQIMDVA